MIHLKRELTFKEYEPPSPDDLIYKELQRLSQQAQGMKLTPSTFMQIQHKMIDFMKWKESTDWRFGQLQGPIIIDIFGERFTIHE